MFNKTYYDGYGYNFYFGNYGYYEYSVIPINYAPYAGGGFIASCCITIACYLMVKYVKLDDGDDSSDDDLGGNVNAVDVDLYNGDQEFSNKFSTIAHMFRKDGPEKEELVVSPIDGLPNNKVADAGVSI